MKDKVSGCRYMVVFQYGSAVLFNIEDHEVESYLEIVLRHASGLLPEMRKDGKFLWYLFLSFWGWGSFSILFCVSSDIFLCLKMPFFYIYIISHGDPWP